MPAAVQIMKFNDYSNPLFLFLAWLGISIIMHSFPSIVDAKGVWNAIWQRETHFIFKILGTPLVILLFICSIGSFAWLDLIFAVGVAMFIPNLLINILA